MIGNPGFMQQHTHDWGIMPANEIPAHLAQLGSAPRVNKASLRVMFRSVAVFSRFVRIGSISLEHLLGQEIGDFLSR